MALHEVLKRHAVREVLCAVLLIVLKSIMLLKSVQDALVSLNLLTLVFWELKLRIEPLVLLL